MGARGRRWLIMRRRIGLVIRELRRSTDPWFRQAGMELDVAERLLGSWHHHIVRRATHPAVMEATAPSRDRNSTGVSRFAGNLTARFVLEA
jgi:hypothetical protein